ncbi:MAG: hypothetical protein HY912_01965 [Desulfomonile tiedjei]|uniref:Polysaccharide chain length determinant N-terminal domain-containing protein n=1 Tax=Desulfomonile tiedjei TaxID=2358 RepID=A0A9D6Z4I1_9BACT|nr:hypothetical protein [Desulfomonile tiedjei]
MSDNVGFSLRDTLNVFYKKIILLKIALVVIPLGVLATCLALPPVYESKAKIIITAKQENPALLQVPRDMASSAVVNLNVDETDLNSEMELLLSPDLWVRAVRKIGLQALKKGQENVLVSFLDELEKSLSGLLGSSKAAVSESKENPEIMETARSLIRKLRVIPAPKSKIIDISFKYDDPAMGQKILSTLLEEYLPYHLEVYSLPGAQGFFYGEGEIYKQKLEKAESDLMEFKKKYGISIIDKQKSELISSIKQIDDSLTELNSNLSQFQNMLGDLKENKIPTGQLTPSAQRGNENTVISVIATQLLRARQKQILAIQHFSPDSRDYQEAEDLVRDLTEKFGTSLQAEIGVLKAKKVSLEESQKGNQTALQVLEGKTEELRKLQLASTIAKERYIQYITKEEEARAAQKGGNKLLNVSIVAAPFTPVEPVFPKTGLMVFGAFLLAVPLGIGMVLVANFLDHTYANPSELEASTGLQVLASFQKVSRTEASGP